MRPHGSRRFAFDVSIQQGLQLSHREQSSKARILNDVLLVLDEVNRPYQRTPW